MIGAASEIGEPPASDTASTPSKSHQAKKAIKKEKSCKKFLRRAKYFEKGDYIFFDLHP